MHLIKLTFKGIVSFEGNQKVGAILFKEIVELKGATTLNITASLPKRRVEGATLNSSFKLGIHSNNNSRKCVTEDNKTLLSLIWQ